MGRVRRLEAELRASFPLAFPCVVRYRRFPPRSNVWGWMERKGGTIHIWINTRGPSWEIEDTLLHEWAHARDLRYVAIERDRERKKSEYAAHHPDEFWLELGRLYRFYSSLHLPGDREDM